MQHYPQRVRLYLAATDLGALLLLGSQLGGLRSGDVQWQHQLAVAAVLCVLVFGAEFLEIAVGQVTYSLVDTALVATLLLVPPPYPLLVAALGTLVYPLRTSQQRLPEAVFNTALMVLRLGLTGLLVGAFVAPVRILDHGFIAALPGMAGILVVYFVLNDLQFATTMALFRGSSPWQVYRAKLAPLWRINGSMYLLGMLCAVLWRYQPLSLLLLALPLWAFRATLQAVELQAEVRHAREKSDQLQLILDASRQLRFSDPSTDALLRPLLVTARKLTGAPLAAAYMVDEHMRTVLQRVAVDGEGADTLLALSLPVPPGAREIEQQVTGNTVAMSIPLTVDAEQRLVGLLRLHGMVTTVREPEVQVLATLAGQAATVIENAALHARVLREAVLDSLTGLANRRSFDQRLDLELAQARSAQSALSLLMIDLDDFGAINNAWGHAAGDEVLRVVGRVLRAVLRSMDMPARYGGDELMVILPGTQLAGAVELGSRLCEAIKALEISWEARTLAISASIGVASLPDHGVTSAALRRAADLAAYTAKKLGKGQVCCPEDMGREPLMPYSTYTVGTVHDGQVADLAAANAPVNALH